METDIKLPFRIDHSSSDGFSRQVYEGLRRAILNGYYQEGECLPPRREMASALGVSPRIPAEAVAKLVAEGLVKSRTRAGCRVLSRSVSRFMGRVLFVSNCTLSYYGFKLVEELRRRLVCAGYSLETTSFCEVGGYARDLGAMELALRQPFTFAVVLSESTEVLKRLDQSEIPFVVISERHFRLNSHPGWVCFHVAAAVPKFVRQCSSAGIRRVCEFGYVRRMSASAASQLRNVGIRVEQILVDVNYGRGILEGIVRGSMEAAFERFGRKGVALPDLIYLPDDYLARGVLTALQELGIRAPQDVRIVSFANAGLGPVYPRELTRMQMNPILDGKILAEEILRAIAGDTVDWKCIAPQYVIGETFAQP